MRKLWSISLLLVLTGPVICVAQTRESLHKLITGKLGYRIFDLPKDVRAVTSITPITSEQISFSADGKVYLATSGSDESLLMYRAAGAGITSVSPFISKKDSCIILTLVTPRKTYLTRSDILPMDTAAAVGILPAGIYESKNLHGKCLLIYGVTRKNSRGVVWSFDATGIKTVFVSQNAVTGLVIGQSDEIFASSGHNIYALDLDGKKKPTIINSWKEPISGLARDPVLGWFVSLSSQIVRLPDPGKGESVFAKTITGPLAISDGHLFVLWRERKQIVRIQIPAADQPSAGHAGPSAEKLAVKATQLAIFYAKFQDTDVLVERCIEQAEIKGGGPKPLTSFVLANHKYQLALNDHRPIVQSYSFPSPALVEHLHRRWKAVDSTLKLYAQIAATSDPNYKRYLEMHKCANQHLAEIEKNQKVEMKYAEIRRINIELQKSSGYLVESDANLKAKAIEIKKSTSEMEAFLKEHSSIKIQSFCGALDTSALRPAVSPGLFSAGRNDFLKFTKDFESGLNDIRDSYWTTWSTVKSNKSNASAQLAGLHMENVVASSNSFMEGVNTIGDDVVSGMISGVQMISGIVELVKQGRENRKNYKDAVLENRFIHADYLLSLMNGYQNTLGTWIDQEMKKVNNFVSDLKRSDPFLAPFASLDPQLRTLYFFLLTPEREHLRIVKPFRIERADNLAWPEFEMVESIHKRGANRFQPKPVQSHSLIADAIIPADFKDLKRDKMVSFRDYFDNMYSLSTFDDILRMYSLNYPRIYIGNYTTRLDQTAEHFMGFYKTEEDATAAYRRILNLARHANIPVNEIALENSSPAETFFHWGVSK